MRQIWTSYTQQQAGTTHKMATPAIHQTDHLKTVLQANAHQGCASELAQALARKWKHAGSVRQGREKKHRQEQRSAPQAQLKRPWGSRAGSARRQMPPSYTRRTAGRQAGHSGCITGGSEQQSTQLMDRHMQEETIATRAEQSWCMLEAILGEIGSIQEHRPVGSQEKGA